VLKLFLIALATLVVFLGCTRLVTAFGSSDLKADEEVVLFPTAANFDVATQRWLVPIHGWIYEPKDDSVWRSALANAFVHGLNIKEDALAQRLFRERARMFLVDNDEAQVRRIMAAQMSRSERLQGADIVIDNSRSLGDLDEVVDELHKEFLLRAELGSA